MELRDAAIIPRPASDIAHGLTVSAQRLELTIGGVPTAVDLPAAGNWRIGRLPPNDLALDDGRASRRHAELRIEPAGACYLADLGSLKGTYVNGRPLTAPLRLHDGDALLIGDTTIIFRSAAASPGATLPGGGATTQVAFDERLVTVLVFDIRESTGIGQRFAPEVVASTFGAFNSAALRILGERGAWGQKLTGDGLMALWAHTDFVVPRATLATIVATCLDLGTALSDASLAAMGTAAKWGAGINTGTAGLGNMGDRQAQDFMPVHDTVNRAFRLEAATKEAGTEIVVGRTCFDLLDPRLAASPPAITLGLKGYKQPEVMHPLDIAAATALVATLSGA